MSERSGEKAQTCSECGRPAQAFRVGRFVEVELGGKWHPGLILARSETTLSVGVAGHEEPMAYGDPEVIPGAARFIRHMSTPPGDRA